jgi:hypothetical protein
MPVTFNGEMFPGAYGPYDIYPVKPRPPFDILDNRSPGRSGIFPL